MFNNYLYFKGLLYFWEEMIMMALLHMAGLENSECIWKIQRKPEVAVCLPWSKEEEGGIYFWNETSACVKKWYVGAQDFVTFARLLELSKKVKYRSKINN